jgi:cell wall-associated NlpC family hydrolase
MPILLRIVRSAMQMPTRALRVAMLAAALVGGVTLAPTLASAHPGPTTTSTTASSTTTTTGPVPVTLKAAQAQQMSALQTQITNTGALLDQLAETYETTTAQLSTLQQEEAAKRAQVAAAQARLEAARLRLRADALIAYMGGIPLTDITDIPLTSTNAAAATSEYEQVAIANTSAVAATYEADVRTLAAADATLGAAETRVQAALTQITTARQLATSAASEQQASLVALSAGNDPSVPGYLAAQSAGGAAVLADKTSTALPPAISAAIWAAALEIGVPYVWGGETPLPDRSAGFDCSGLVQWAYGKAGIALPRTAQDQYDAVTPVPASAVQPGDLVFWNDGTTSVQHVAIYVGQGLVLEAPSTGSVVSYAPLWATGLVGFGAPVLSPVSAGPTAT